MTLTIPEFATVVLIGASGSGKSSFAAKHFLPTEVLSSDHYRGVVCDDENDQSSTPEAFALLHHIMGVRLKNRRTVVIDATNVQHQSRQHLVNIARQYHSMLVAIVLNVPEEICQARNAERPDRQFGEHVVRNHVKRLKRSLKHLRREGFRYVYVLNSVEEIEKVQIERTPLWNNKRDLQGPFDIIGDVHGCFDELRALLDKLGYVIQHKDSKWHVTPPLDAQGNARKVIFVGDLVDRGPGVDKVLDLVMHMVEQDQALCVAGNHEAKLIKSLQGKKVKVRHGLQASLDQLGERSDAFVERVKTFLDSLISHYMFDDGRLCVAHAGLREDLQGRASGKVRSFALYGETSGETDEFGLPVRHNWAADYRGDAMVVYGHTPTPRATWLNNTICLDTGCVFGGKLTALRYPEREIMDVDAASVYAEPVRPLEPVQSVVETGNAINLKDVSGKLVLPTTLHNTVIVQEEQTTAALEIMSRFAIHPNWLIYLPPTMSPTRTSQKEGYLEYPDDALIEYRKWGVEEVICQVKHMGSRALIVLTQTDDVAQQRFGQNKGSCGVIYTRTGRPFFKDSDIEQALLQRLRDAMTRANLWQTLETDWVCLDAELMPWSAKAQSLLRTQYAAVATAAQHGMDAALQALQTTATRLDDATPLYNAITRRAQEARQLAGAYAPYCWEVQSLDDYRIAPFHLLATEGALQTDKDHLWHMETLGQLVDADKTPTLMKTTYRVVQLNDQAQCDALCQWWEELTEAGEEGLVIKPRDFVTHQNDRLIQPAIKCRGQNYLRLIYGPEYALPDNLKRLRQRGLSRKRGNALREFALGLDGLHQFVHHGPMRQAHAYIFAILALESDPIDPRL